MGEGDRDVWVAKLACWVLGPGRRAAERLRPGSCERATLSEARQICFGAAAPDGELESLIERAEQWAMAMDRPRLPEPAADRPAPEYAGIDLLKTGCSALTHPLSASSLSVGSGSGHSLPEVDLSSVLLDCARAAGNGASSKPDSRGRFLEVWRKAPDPGWAPVQDTELWSLLPADPRVPDQSVWEHLSLTSAFAGAMAGDPGGRPALLAVSLGPVQSFISQARSTTDLWAGSHLLANLSWQAMKVVCTELGPDAVIFPSLHGVPLVDLWLEELGVGLGDHVSWRGDGAFTDANPLFAASLPNRFVAVVPASRANELARSVTEAVRRWALDKATEAATRAFRKVTEQSRLPAETLRQVEEQLSGFPEVHWAAVAWPAECVQEDPGQEGALQTLRSALARMQGEAVAEGSEDAWCSIGPGEALGDREPLLPPGPGMLYPLIHELLERVGLAAKATRSFGPRTQQGYRCMLTGEDEWLSPSPATDRFVHPSRATDSVWRKLADKGEPWVRRGEHLGALATLKRQWPALFMEEIRRRAAGEAGDGERHASRIHRYVVSTHTMALASSFARWIEKADGAAALPSANHWQAVCRHLTGEGPGCRSPFRVDPVALPRRLASSVRRLARKGGLPDFPGQLARIPDRLDQLRDTASLTYDPDTLECLQEDLKRILGSRPEAYYALILMDGDRMGGWLSGNDGEHATTLESALDPELRQRWRDLAANDPGLQRVLDFRRPGSPARHVAISKALNAFSQLVARVVVEDLYLGKLLYCGGDDLLAMVSVDDLLGCMLSLRCAYSGAVPPGDHRLSWELLPWIGSGDKRLQLNGGFARVRTSSRGSDRFTWLRMMGEKATASAGAVVAHHTAPLQAVLGELRRAEHRAKEDGGRNAFSVSLMKRSGGTTHLTTGWRFGGAGCRSGEAPFPESTPMGVLLGLWDTLRVPEVSRRAVFQILTWLTGMPDGPGSSPGGATLDRSSYERLLTDTITYQLIRQDQRRSPGVRSGHRMLAEQLVKVALAERPEAVPSYLSEMLTVAEFLAREGRADPVEAGGAEAQEPVQEPVQEEAAHE